MRALNCPFLSNALLRPGRKVALNQLEGTRTQPEPSRSITLANEKLLRASQNDKPDVLAIVVIS